MSFLGDKQLIEGDIEQYGKMFVDLRCQMRKRSIAADGIHLVTEWETGGSDANNLQIHTAEKLLKEFPQTDPYDAQAFFDGIRDGFIIDRYEDNDGTPVKCLCYFPCSEILSAHEVCYEDQENSITLTHRKIDDIINSAKFRRENYTQAQLDKYHILTAARRELNIVINNAFTDSNSLQEGLNICQSVIDKFAKITEKT